MKRIRRWWRARTQCESVFFLSAAEIVGHRCQLKRRHEGVHRGPGTPYGYPVTWKEGLPSDG